MKLKEGESFFKFFFDVFRKFLYDKLFFIVKENHGGVHVYFVLLRVLIFRELVNL